MAMIVGCQFASWEFVEKNFTSHLSALRTIFLDVLHSVVAVTGREATASWTFPILKKMVGELSRWPDLRDHDWLL